MLQGKYEWSTRESTQELIGGFWPVNQLTWTQTTIINSLNRASETEREKFSLGDFTDLLLLHLEATRPLDTFHSHMTDSDLSYDHVQ